MKSHYHCIASVRNGFYEREMKCDQTRRESVKALVAPRGVQIIAVSDTNARKTSCRAAISNGEIAAFVVSALVVPVDIGRGSSKH